jgi:hypothetical protein
MLQILFLAAAGAVGYFFGRKSAFTGKDHDAVITILAFGTPKQRKAILDMPAAEIPSLPTVPGVIQPPLPGLFTAEEKKAILKDVADKQQQFIRAGQQINPEQLVTPDEMELRVPAPAAPRTSQLMGSFRRPQSVPVRVTYWA